MLGGELPTYSSWTISSDLGPQKSLPRTQNLVPKAIKTELRAPPVAMKPCQELVPHPLLWNSILTADWLLRWRPPATLRVIGCLKKRSHPPGDARRSGCCDDSCAQLIGPRRGRRARARTWFLSVCAHARTQRIGVLGRHETHVLPLDISHLHTMSQLGIIIKTWLHVQCCFHQIRDHLTSNHHVR